MDEKNCCDDGCKCQEEPQNEPRYSGEYKADGSLTASNGLNHRDLSDCDEEPDIEADNGKMHDLVIKQMDYGYLVKAGCQTLCVETQDHLVALFSAYVRDHSRVRTLHAKGKLDTVYVDAIIKKMQKAENQTKKVRPAIDIGVIGSSLQDVRDYLADVVPLAVRGVTPLRKYMLETQDYIIYYYAITTVEHTRGIGLDKFVETHRARDNREFQKIIECRRHCLKSQRS